MGWWQKITTARGRLATSSCDLLYPQICLACSQPLDVAEQALPFCKSCYQQLAAVDRNSCRRCGALVDAPIQLDIQSCIACKDESYRFIAATTLSSYKDLLRDCVLRAKHPRTEAMTRQLGYLLGDVRREILESWRCDVVVPIPMFWLRRMLHGANSPDLIAQSLAETLKLPLGVGGLRRRKNTHTQNDLSPPQRKKNLRNAFAIGNGCNFRGSTVLLVDDILTTGATCNEATRTLLAAGASEVYVAAVARAVL